MRIECVALSSLDADPVGSGDRRFNQRFIFDRFLGGSRGSGCRIHCGECREWPDICGLACVYVKVVRLTAWSCGPGCLRMNGRAMSETYRRVLSILEAAVGGPLEPDQGWA